MKSSINYVYSPFFFPIVLLLHSSGNFLTWGFTLKFIHWFLFQELIVNIWSYVMLLYSAGTAEGYCLVYFYTKYHNLWFICLSSTVCVSLASMNYSWNIWKLMCKMFIAKPAHLHQHTHVGSSLDCNAGRFFDPSSTLGPVKENVTKRVNEFVNKVWQWTKVLLRKAYLRLN